MNKHLRDETLHSELIDKLMEKNIRGGQRADGSQKDGFLKYERNRPTGVYDTGKGEYVALERLKERLDSKIGNPPAGFSPWRKLLIEPNKADLLSTYFSNLRSADSFGTELARNYLARSKEIGERLVKDGVTNSADDVNAVLTNGFFWLYGPINDYI